MFCTKTDTILMLADRVMLNSLLPPLEEELSLFAYVLKLPSIKYEETVYAVLVVDTVAPVRMEVSSARFTHGIKHVKVAISNRVNMLLSESASIFCFVTRSYP